jgi:hypothetical protein
MDQQAKHQQAAEAVKCEITLERGQYDLERHLERSAHRVTAQRLQTKQTVVSPGYFDSMYHWADYICERFKFEELEVAVDCIEMVLRNGDGSIFAEAEIYSRRVLWDVDEIEAAFAAVSAQTATFTLTLTAGIQPDFDKVKMPPGMEHLLEFNEQDECALPQDQEDTLQELVARSEMIWVEVVNVAQHDQHPSIRHYLDVYGAKAPDLYGLSPESRDTEVYTTPANDIMSTEGAHPTASLSTNRSNTAQSHSAHSFQLDLPFRHSG